MNLKPADYLTLLRIILTPVCIAFISPIAHREWIAAVYSLYGFNGWA